MPTTCLEGVAERLQGDVITIAPTAGHTPGILLNVHATSTTLRHIETN